MKKTTKIVKQTKTYEIQVLINNTALVSIDNESALLNIKSNTFVTPLNEYQVVYDEIQKVYEMVYSLDYESERNDPQGYQYYIENTGICIYDAKKEKMLVREYELVKNFGDYNELSLIYNPDTKTYHLFDLKLMRSITNIFNESLENVTLLYSQFSKKYLEITKNGKKGIYINGIGLITPIKYDNIEIKNGYTILSKNNRKAFTKDIEKDELSEEYDEITFDNEGHMICKSDDMIYVFMTKTGKLIANYRCDNIEHVRTTHNANYFIVERCDSYGYIKSEIIKNQNNTLQTTQILDMQYDEIYRLQGVLVLKKNNLLGALNLTTNKTIKIKYNDINQMSSLLLGVKNKKIDIIDLEKDNEIIVTECDEVEQLSRTIFKYKKDNLYGYIELDRNKTIVIEPKYNDIKYIGNDLLIVTKDNKQGIAKNYDEIIPLEYDEIKNSEIKPNQSNQEIYFALKRRGKYELNRINTFYDILETVSDRTFTQIDFFKDIMVLKDGTFTYIYNYEEKLLKTFDKTTTVVPIIKNPNDEYNKQYIYEINGVKHFYKDNKLEEVLTGEKLLYVTEYIIESQTYEIETEDEIEHDRFCSYIDSLSDEEASIILDDFIENESSYKENYPTLKLKQRSNI